MALDGILEWNEESCSNSHPESFRLVRSQMPQDISNTTIYSDGREYDLLLHAPVSEEELGFYSRHAITSGGPVLELACGTGRLTIPLSKSGLDITGIDIAESMLDVAREKAVQSRAAPTLVNADARSFSLGRKFGMIFFPNNSLGHLHTLDDIRSCFSCVREHLTEGGLFIIDFFNPSLALLMRDPATRYPVASYFDNRRKYTVVTETVRYDASAQISYAIW